MAPVAIVRLWLWLPNPPLTAGSLPATILAGWRPNLDCTAFSFTQRTASAQRRLAVIFLISPIGCVAPKAAIPLSPVQQEESSHRDHAAGALVC